MNTRFAIIKARCDVDIVSAFTQEDKSTVATQVLEQKTDFVYSKKPKFWAIRVPESYYHRERQVIQEHYTGQKLR